MLILVTRLAVTQALNVDIFTSVVACFVRPVHAVQASSEPAAGEFARVAICQCLLTEWLFGFYRRGLTQLKPLTAH